MATRPPSSRIRTGRRLATLTTAAALIAAGLVTFGVPAQSASALAIDCSYDAGLSVFIGSGRDGYTCMGGGTRTPGTVYGSGSLPGQTATGGASVGSACKNPMPQIPDAFYGWGNIRAWTQSYNYTRTDGSKWHADYTWYSRNGHYVAVRDIETSAGKPLEMSFADFSLIDSGVTLRSTFNCATDAGWVSQEPILAAQTHEVAGGPTPTPSSSAVVETKATLAPVPFQPGKFFLRIDLADKWPAPTTTPASISLGLDHYTIDGLVSSPRDSSCPEALSYAESCTTPLISAGETQTFTFVVKLRSGESAQSPIQVTTLFEDHVRMGHVFRTGLNVTTTVAAPTE